MRNVTVVPAVVLITLSIVVGAHADQVSYTDTFNGLTNITNEQLQVPQFDSLGGTLELLSVSVELQSTITASLAGQIANSTSKMQSFTYTAWVKDATTSLEGPGASANDSSTSLLNYGSGSQNLSAGGTFTLPGATQTLNAVASDTLTVGTDDLSAFVGTGDLTYLLNAGATGGDNLKAKANLGQYTTLSSKGSGSVTVTYNYAPVAVPLPAPLAGGIALFCLALLAKLRPRMWPR